MSSNLCCGSMYPPYMVMDGCSYRHACEEDGKRSRGINRLAMLLSDVMFCMDGREQMSGRTLNTALTELVGPLPPSGQYESRLMQILRGLIAETTQLGDNPITPEQAKQFSDQLANAVLIMNGVEWINTPSEKPSPP
jgi:hypothetical protein